MDRGQHLIPWIGVMAIGYAAGPYCLPGRSGRLVRIGALLTLAFFVLRIPNLYGEPSRWILSESPTATLISFFNTTKYPAFLQFLLMTLVVMYPACLWFAGVKIRRKGWWMSYL